MTPGQQQVRLASAFVGLVGVTCLLALVGLGAVGRPLYLAGAIAIAWATLRRSPWLYVAATLWAWLLTAFVRRFIEWRTGFNPTDLVLATPNLMTLLMLPAILSSPGLLRRRELVPAAAVAVAVCYGLCVSLFRGDITPAAVAAADWLGPLFYAFFVVSQASAAGTLAAHLRVFLPLVSAVVVPYGLWQYFVLPDWDAQWLSSADVSSFGQAVPMALRVFGTTNNPGMLAFWLCCCIVLAPVLRSRAMLALLPAAAFLVIVSLVRAAYGALGLGLTAMLLLGRGHATRPLLASAVAFLVLAVTFSLVDPGVGDRVLDRFFTLTALEGDDSARTRELLYQQTPEIIDENPLGLGIGAVGRGAVAAGSGSWVVVDSGPLAAFLTLGWAGGTLYVFGLLAAACNGIATAWRSRDPLVLGFACAALCPLSTFILVNVNGFDGVLVWLFFSCATVLDAQPCYAPYPRFAA